MGEIGGNDYNYAIMQRRTGEGVPSLISTVVNNIGFTIEELIKLGLRQFWSGAWVPVYLSMFKSSSIDKDYNPKTGCLNWPNEKMYHNELLQKELGRLRELHPHVTIIYADYYNAAMRFYLSPTPIRIYERISS
ncbi:UNVERIFIED_CONTAM: GDSL esterase/lipase [Sesamum calycinum]|uniref:GDSL esterase/lipase n=1 Tax=Sesamum calycinum TaxID=2727403 RepID=A0AAW2N3D8_9LAMI